jgi:hypothetical protein
VNPRFSGVRVTGSLLLCIVFCRSLFELLSFYFWPLCCLFFHLRILITPLVFANSSSTKTNLNKHVDVVQSGYHYHLVEGFNICVFNSFSD